SGHCRRNGIRQNHAAPAIPSRGRLHKEWRQGWLHATSSCRRHECRGACRR
ncbi:hypothetical protein BN1708_019677, partial [Verticillium longisporum]